MCVYMYISIKNKITFKIKELYCLRIHWGFAHEPLGSFPARFRSMRS